MASGTARRARLRKKCGEICSLEGADYEGLHAITTFDSALELKLETPGGVGTRVYMLDASGKRYKQFDLLNQELTFDVDMSTLPCGSNGALYFSKMDADGGIARFLTNNAGAEYGTGYCDAQCTKEVKFINGEANLEHNFNPYRMGLKKFYGRGKSYDIDTTRPFSVITQFITDDDTETDDRVVVNPASTWATLNGTDSITDAMCNSSKALFNDHPYVMGGLAQLSKQIVGGMTLVMSIWVDYGSNMTWLDSFKTGEDPKDPGALRGDCPNPGGDP
ncbi:hypothetical protein PInf_024711 [Phytophthora infestans]|nr:hypothetical protein PInf_024711 [Phytophthora infestans]